MKGSNQDTQNLDISINDYLSTEHPSKYLITPGALFPGNAVDFVGVINFVTSETKCPRYSFLCFYICRRGAELDVNDYEDGEVCEETSPSHPQGLVNSPDPNENSSNFHNQLSPTTNRPKRR